MDALRRRKERESDIKKSPDMKELSDSEEEDLPKNQFIVTWNKATGVVVDEDLGGYPAYRIRLSKVDEIFKRKTQSWDKDYKNAQKIFG